MTEIKLEIVFTRAAPAFDNLFMGCVFNINTVHKTVEKLTFQALNLSSTESFKRRAPILSRPTALLVFKTLMDLETKSPLMG